MTTRLKSRFDALGERRALVTFITAGDPTLEHTVPAMHALVAGGTDVIELGIPFSDPEAEGPAIQASSERALANGATLRSVLDDVRAFRETDPDTPVVLMGYLNSVLAMDNFPVRAGDAGVDGLIMVNLPPEEAQPLQGELAAQGIDLIFLVAPTSTPERCRAIVNKASGFVYYVSLKGITGAGNLDVDEVKAKVAALREMQTAPALPVCVGFGIKDAETARAIGEGADGVVVGSALVQMMAEHREDTKACAAALEDAVAALRRGLDTLGA